jgi:nitrous oxidase accessory protein
MMYRRSFLRILSYLALLLVLAQTHYAKAQTEGQITTPQGSFTSLKAALSAAQNGDIIDVYGGVHAGPLSLDKPVTIIGHDRPVLDGGGEGTVLKLVAPDITLKGFVISNSGDSLDQENSGIAVEAPGAIIENNYLENTLFGIYLRQADGSVLRDNVITSKDLDLPRRGDPIRVWYSNDVLIENNQVSDGRDVVLWYSENLSVRDNEVSGGRYGLHFMYCDDAIIQNNVLANNSVGTFLMYSRRLQLLNNTIAHNRGPSGFGVGLKDMDDAVIQNNLFLDNRIGAHLDNSPREVNSVGHFEGNVFAYNDVGVILMPSVRHNEFSGNSFVDNEQQVSIAGGGGREQDNAWTIGDQGNYWSDYVGFDSDADGRGDVPFKSERLFEDLMDKNTSLRLFMYSPIEQAIDFAARAAPFVKPQPKLTDESPLMEPIVPENLPSLPEQKSIPFWVVSLGLLFLAVLVLALGSDTQWFRRRSKPRQSLPQSLPPTPQHPVAK